MTAFSRLIAVLRQILGNFRGGGLIEIAPLSRNRDQAKMARFG
jgi:hypothetical protein